MSRRDRETLNAFFGEGCLPTHEHFKDLIDSTLNLDEEGFDKRPDVGLMLRTQANYPTLISFYRNQSTQPQWQTAFAGNHDQLVLKCGGQPAAAADGTAGAPLLTLDPRQRVGINQAAPRYALDIGGTLGAAGRMGTPPVPELAAAVVADGKPHDVLVDLQGCQAFEVMAGVGYRGRGRFALLHAVAMNVNHPAWWDDLLRRKRRIHQQHAYYTRRCDRLQLQWVSQDKKNRPYGEGAKYKLQIRTACDYRADERPRGQPAQAGDEVRIQVYLTKLWEDTEMSGSQPRSARAQAEAAAAALRHPGGAGTGSHRAGAAGPGPHGSGAAGTRPRSTGAAGLDPGSPGSPGARPRAAGATRP